ncbi:caspase family protein [Streptomyces tailanensis]|uniref:caspase family protein n=1 Tax=Streptomyces tailanensis TaxID=2569858 RepID=UPI00155B3F51|nr:caspase family protein [Streptomyces tailanensis]
MSEQQAGGRRYLIAAGTRRYAEFDELPEAHTDVERIVSLFETMGYERVLGEVSRDPGAEQFENAVADWCADTELASEDVLVLYYAGHGDRPAAGGYRLACPLSTAQRPRSWLSLENLAATVSDSALRNVLFIIDACHASAGATQIGAVADSFTAIRPRRDTIGSGTWVMASARHRDLADDGAFTVELERAVSMGDGPSQRYLSPAGLADRVTRAFERSGRQQHAVCSVTDQAAQPPFFPNPHYEPGAEVGGSDHSGEATDFTSHFAPRGRGVEYIHDPGSYFTGRKRALDVLRGHLNGPGGNGPVVVTAAPGSGKSAVLGRLVLDGNGTEAGYRIDVSINARHQTMDELVARLATAADVTAASPSSLLSALADRTAAFHVVIDSLDEAGPAGDKAEARRIAWDLLRHLATVPCVRLVIGARRELLLHLGDRVPVVDLDSVEYSEDTSTAEYIERILTDVGSPYERHHPTARVIAEGVAQRADKCFLVARMTASALRRGEPIDITVPGWARQLPSDAGGAFEAYLSRLPNDRRVTAIPLLTTLAFGEGHGVPRTGVWTRVASRISGTTLAESDVDALLEEDSSYLTAVDVDGRKYFRLYHQELADHLKTRALRYRDLRDVQECFVGTLLELVPKARGTDERDWPRAHPYIRDHLATHAAAAGLIDDLVEDPAFVLTAAAPGLVPAVQHAKRNTVLAMVVERCAEMLVGRNDPGLDRAAELAFVARAHGAMEFARRATKLSGSVERLWIEPRQVTAHRIVGRHSESTYSTTSVKYGWVIRDVVTPQGRHVIVALSRSATHVHFWPLDDPSQATVLPHSHAVRDLAVLTDAEGRALAITLDDVGELRVWNLSDLSLLHRHPDTGCSWLGDQELLSDGSPVVVGWGKEQVVVINPLSGEVRLTVYCASEDRSPWRNGPSARFVRCGGPDIWLTICDKAAGTLTLHPLENQVGGGMLLDALHKPSLQSKAEEPDGTTVVALREPGDVNKDRPSRLTLINVVSKQTTVSEESSLHSQRSGDFVTVEGSRATYVAADRRSQKTLQMGTDPCERPLRIWPDNFTVAPFAHDGRPHAIVAGTYGGVRVLDCTTGRTVGSPLRGHESAVCAVHLLSTSTADALDILAVGNDGTARLWHWAYTDSSSVDEQDNEAGVDEFAVAHTELVRGWPTLPTEVIASSWRGIRRLDARMLDQPDGEDPPISSVHVLDTSPIMDEHCAEEPATGVLNVLAKEEEHGARFNKLTSAKFSWLRLHRDGRIDTFAPAELFQVPWATEAHVLPPSGNRPRTSVVAYDPTSASIVLLPSQQEPADTMRAPWPVEGTDAVYSTAYTSRPGQAILFTVVRQATRGDTTVKGTYLTRHTEDPGGPTLGYFWDLEAKRQLRAEPLELPPDINVLSPCHTPRGASLVALASHRGSAVVLDVETEQQHVVRGERVDIPYRDHRFRQLAHGHGYFIRWATTRAGDPVLLYMDPVGEDDNAYSPVAVWNSTEPDSTQQLPVHASRLLWTGHALNGEALVAVSDRHGVALCHLPSCQKVWGIPVPALVTSLVVLPNFDMAIGTQQGVVLLRPRLPSTWRHLADHA